MQPVFRFTISPDLKGIKTKFIMRIKRWTTFTISPDLKGIKTLSQLLYCPQFRYSQSALI